jgi:hypothetical protein
VEDEFRKVIVINKTTNSPLSDNGEGQKENEPWQVSLRRQKANKHI